MIVCVPEVSANPLLFCTTSLKVPGGIVMPVAVPYILVVEATAGMPIVAAGGNEGVKVVD